LLHLGETDIKFVVPGAYLTWSRSFLGGFYIMLQYIEKFSGSTLNRVIGRNILLLYGEYAEFSVYLPEFG
jgi:hypothetical protein